MTCEACGNEWEVHLADVVRQDEKTRLVQCPRCGRVRRQVLEGRVWL